MSDMVPAAVCAARRAAIREWAIDEAVRHVLVLEGNDYFAKLDTGTIWGGPKHLMHHHAELAAAVIAPTVRAEFSKIYEASKGF